MSLCSALDDFLAHDLVGDERARFVAHLPDCPACRRAVREQERMDALLTEATLRLDDVPLGLTEQVTHQVRVARRRRVAVAVTALAASIAAVWLFNRPVPRPVEPSPALASVQPETPAPRTADRARVTFPAGARVAAVPVPSESPNVTFLWLFPERRPETRCAPPEDDPTSLPERSFR